MQAPVSLNKTNPLLPAEDYKAMRKEGINDIEHLSSDIWTEYNTSDPGITILEAVSYAITDLAYRTGFDIKDLLAPAQLTDNTWKQIFYTARQILHNNPVTIDDYRKLIIDVKGVRNAWIEPGKEYEVPLWMNYNVVELEEHPCACEEEKDKICFGKLSIQAATNADVTNYRTTATAAYNATKTTLDAEKTAKQATSTQLQGQINMPDIDPVRKATLQAQKDELDARIAAITAEMLVLDKIIGYLANPIIIPPKIVELEGLYNVMVEYEEDVLAEDHREEVRQLVVDRLSRHRNLCEDFLTVEAVEYLDFGLMAAIELEENADPDMVVAQLFFTVYKYFTPSVPFNTVQQMMDKGYLIDEIFEGPALKHGFIDDAELEKTALYRDIRLSDVINEVAEISGIKAITYLHMPADAVNQPGNKNYFNEWLDLLRQQRKIARIDPAQSQVICCKDRELITYNIGRKEDRSPLRMKKLFADLKSLERKYKLEGHEIDFQVPAGENMELEDYFPVTYSLPMCYGVSETAGLPGNADAKRKVQALQLKGYLLFFEQLLKGHLVQLNHLRDLFTFDDTVKHTYFNKALTEIQGLSDLLVNFGNHDINHQEDIIKDFAGTLQNLVETPITFHKRRNTFLNHMLARFSEDLSEYETMSRWLTPAKVEERLIHDKTRILKDGEYYHISTNRGKGYNYAQLNVWDTTNVSGAERRLSRLLGFENATRRTLAPAFIVSEPVMIIDDKTKLPVWKTKNGQHVNVIKVLDPDNKDAILLTSVEVEDGCCTELLMNDMLEHADDRRYYKFHDELRQRSRKAAGQLGTFWLELYDDTDPANAVLLATSEKSENKTIRDTTFKRIQQLMEKMNTNEGLHLIEHILLRPKLDQEFTDGGITPIDISFIHTCLDKCDLGIGVNDGTDVPDYWKKVTRIPADKCYDNMPWVLEYFRMRTNPATGNKEPLSVLFQETFPDASKLPTMLKFRLYTGMTKRILDLQEYGAERINYEIVSNNSDDPAVIKYKFIIHGNKQEVLAQSAYLYNKRTAKQIKDGTVVPDDIDDEIAGLMQYFSYQMDWYCAANPCDNNEDPYSFRTTVILPCWPKRFRDLTFRNLVEKTIQTEFPAHVHTKIVWVGISEMQKFEKIYQDWLLEMAQTEVPGYEKLNPLIDAINGIQPCGSCEDDCSRPQNS
ncbi:hypothetical protein CLV51_105171 [Chitinophaga niastensis]|uniref:Uncharacterized protein n=1 Tax=Chitinophaga niastensis TaxID=536980 RepID=A0A2P8HF02_CHINA|nr:hypothetical protein [Chitinophaga niastensis]PSL44799.1 hypothetical protein CLV51_105171 [Chitinophaga niastensis]